MQFTFQGESAELRRLGLSDIFEVQRICTEIIQGAKVRDFALNIDETGEDLTGLLMFFVSGVDFCEERLTKWLKSLFKGGYDGEIYLPGIMELLEALLRHPDLKAFLELARKLMPSLVDSAVKAST